MVNPPLGNLAVEFGIGLNVILLLTPVTGTVLAAGVVKVRAVTVSALFLLIAATASFVASLDFAALGGTGFRMIAGIGCDGALFMAGDVFDTGLFEGLSLAVTSRGKQK